MTTKVSTKTARAGRTAIQAGPAWVITEFSDAWIYDMNDRQFGVTVALLMMVFAYLLPILENYSGRAVLRSNNTTSPVTTEV